MFILDLFTFGAIVTVMVHVIARRAFKKDSVICSYICHRCPFRQCGRNKITSYCPISIGVVVDAPLHVTVTLPVPGSVLLPILHAQDTFPSESAS